MKKFLSFMLATIMIFMIGVMPVYAEDNGFEVGCFCAYVEGGDRYIHISWDDTFTADHFEVLIENTKGEEVIFRNLTGSSYAWEAGYDIIPDTIFTVMVYAYDKYGTLIGESESVSFYTYVVMWDYWGIYGDVDKDNIISVLDATLVQRKVARVDTFDSVQLMISDVNDDDDISVIDASYIQFFCAGINIDDNITHEGFWCGGVSYDLVVVEPEEDPTVVPTVVEPTDPTSETPEPTAPYNPPVAASSSIVCPL